MSKENPNELKIINKNERLKYRLIINELKHQLEEKDKLLKCYQDEEKLIADILGDKDLTIIGSRVHLENLVVELKNKIKDRDIIIEEKDKEIERLKVFEKVYYQNQIQASQETINKLLQSAYQSPIAIGLNQIAITELEKVKILLQNAVNYEGYTFIGIYDAVNNQIKKLKGE